MGVDSRGANTSYAILDGRLTYLWPHLITVMHLTSHLHKSLRMGET